MELKKYPICMEIAGDTAMWTRPDTGDSPCSYPVPTFSAVRGIFESVLWGPGVIVVPTKVEICKPPKFHSYATNYGGPLRQGGKKGEAPRNNYQFFATVLNDVCYRLYGYVVLNPNKIDFSNKAREWNRHTTSPGHAYSEIFKRRLKRGQSYRTVCLGWNEFPASYFGPFREETSVCKDMPDIVIPSMLREVFRPDQCSEMNAIFDTDLLIHEGTLEFPERGLEYDK